MRHAKTAFTLIEVLISLSIMIILLSAAFSMWKYFLNHTEDDVLQKQFVDALALAKVQAKVQHQAIAFCKSQDSKTCGGDWQDGQLIFIDQFADGVVHDQQQILSVLKTRALHGKIVWKAFPAYRDYLQFLPNELHSDNGTFLHCHQQTAIWAIIMNKVGRVRVVLPDQHGVIVGSQGKPLLC